MRVKGHGFLAFFLFGLSACGYRPLYGGGDSTARFHVALVRSVVADAIAGDEVLSGVRATLAREGALASGSGYPRVEVELLRADDRSEGVAAVGGATGVPKARASEVGVIARAWLVRAEGGPREVDTGDVRAFNVVTTGGSEQLGAEALRHDDALRAVARRVGERLGMRVLGHPIARDESMGDRGD
jgi:hypothetical protein